MNEARYLRHYQLPEVGPQGQTQLQASKVLIVGAGGLGSPVALYLAAAGVGTLGLIDPDVVSLSNLQRQILYATDQVGQPKVEQARQRLQALNPQVQLQTWSTALQPENLELIKHFDVIVDGTDNLSTRYLLNDACVWFNKPLVYGSVYRFAGQLASFDRQGGCYRCLYPDYPEPEAVPSCNQAGVLGVLPGLIGTLQASEVLRLLLNWGPGLSNQLLLVHLQELQFERISLPQNPNCQVCSPSAVLHSAQDTARWLKQQSAQLSVREAQGFLLQPQVQVLDVRENSERHAGHLPGLHIPLAELQKAVNLLNPKLPLLVYCQKGTRSLQAVKSLKAQGFSEIWSLQGGFEAWQQAEMEKTNEQ